MGAGHSHSHRPAGAGASALSGYARRLALALVLCLGYMGAELVGGLLTGSLALLADAAHMLSDAAALGLSLFAVAIARRPPTSRRTFGLYRTEILAALVNAAALLAIAVFIFIEAWRRLGEPREVDGLPMLLVAAGGLAINLVTLAILSPGRGTSLNLRGAWLHVVTDTLGSVQAIVAGLLIWRFGWAWADPIASALIGALVVYSGWSLLKETVDVLMEAAPPHIDVDEVRTAISEIGGVADVHDLHVWTITSGIESLSAHVVVDDRPGAETLTEIRAELYDRFGIDHLTIQLEPVGFEERHPLACP